MGMAKGLTKLLKKGIFCIAIAIKCDVTGEGTLIVLTLVILGRTGSTSVGCWEEDLGLSAAGLQKTWSTEMLVVRLIQAACRCVPHAAGVMDQEEDIKRREGERWERKKSSASYCHHKKWKCFHSRHFTNLFMNVGALVKAQSSMNGVFVNMYGKNIAISY